MSPRTEFHEARLRVEREPLDVDLAVRLENGRRIPLRRRKKKTINDSPCCPFTNTAERCGATKKNLPFDVAVVVQNGFSHCRHDVFSVRTGPMKNRSMKKTRFSPQPVNHEAQ